MEEIYTDSFYDIMRDKENSCRQAARYVFDLIRPASVVDMGCGNGAWLALFKECGVSEIRGYDGDYVRKDMLVISEDEFTPFDLTKKLPVERRYDMAMSLEVAEHLEERLADQFIANITELSDVVLFSASIPGQGGDGHINEQWPSYWRTKFENNGFTCCDCIRDHCWNMEDLDYYYRQNIVLYVKNDRKN